MTNSSQTSTRKAARISTETWISILMILSLITMGVHLYLTIQHYQLKLGLAQSPAVCNVNTTFNCDAVGISRFATLFGIPMALLGLITQVIFFIYLLAVRFHLSSHSERLRRYLFWFSLFVVGVSLVMGFFSSFFLGTYCLFCIAAYVLSFLQIGAAWKAQYESPVREFGSDLKIWLTANRWPLVLSLLIPLFGWIGNSVILDSYGFGRLNQLIQDSLAHWESSQPQNFKLDQGLTTSRTEGDSKFTIVEFADFLCPHCKTASPTLESFTQAHPDVKLVFKMFPLDGKCNKAIQRQGDGLRCRLSAAVYCAQTQGQKGWDAHHWIFDRQESYSSGLEFNKSLEDMSKELGLDAAAMATCVNSDEAQEAILAQAQEGATANITGTPSVFVNGKALPAGQYLPVLEALYRKLNP